MSESAPDRLPVLSRLLVRLLDRTKRADYVFAVVFAAFPIALSRVLGLHESTDEYVGYWRAANFTTLVLILPGLLWLLRWTMGRVAPVLEPWPPSVRPPILELLPTEAGKKTVYLALRRWMLSPKLVVAVMLVVIIIHVLDMRQLFLDYSLPCRPATEKDWATAFKTNPEIARGANLLFVFVAYSVQFAVVIVAVASGFLIIAHNRFFLRRIYQRRWVPDGQEENYFQIDLADSDQCFGFRKANRAFNTQVVLLMSGGMLMLVTRFFSAPKSWTALMEEPNSIVPDVGQAIIAFGWLAGFLVISMPALVKLLPRLPIGGSERASRTITSYLREFISPERWPFGREPTREQISALGARFASNAFWPSGNNRASQLFFFTIWIGLIVFFTPPTNVALGLIAALLVTGVLAYLGRSLIFRLMNSSLRYIDNALVEIPPGGPPELRLPGNRLEAGVFISYRRADTAAYTGRLYDYLTDYFDRDRIFIDIDDIAAGAEFPKELERALDSSSAVLVMIGPTWTTITGSDGAPRIKDPNDWVRQEVATGLTRGIMVVPVLVGGAQMPSATELPPELASLCDRNASEISDKRWDYDAKLLMEALQRALDERERTWVSSDEGPEKPVQQAEREGRDEDDDDRREDSRSGD